MKKKEAIEWAKTEGNLVWHYANLDTLNRILDNNYLLTTEVAFQNDIRETVTADHAFGAALEELAEDPTYELFAKHAVDYLDQFDDAHRTADAETQELLDRARFIVCASTESDSLYAWRTYGTGTSIGCAIGIDPTVDLGVVTPPSKNSSKRSSPRTAFHVTPWISVEYGEDKARKYSRDLLTELGDRWKVEYGSGDEEGSSRAQSLLFGEFTELRSEVRAIAKDASFSDEKERRITVDGIGHSSTPSVVFTPSSMGPRPHLRLAVSPKGKAVPDASKAPTLPIRAIRLGPGAPDVAVTSLQWLLLAHDYRVGPVEEPHEPPTWEKSVVVLRSEHPYRSR